VLVPLVHAILSLMVAVAIAGIATPTFSAVDPRYFPETKYRIEDDRFWEFFQRRGGVKTFGYPSMREA
jgi:hypothetical protein